MAGEFQLRGEGALIYGELMQDGVHDAPFHSSTRIEERIGHGMAELLHLEKDWRALANTSIRTRFIHTFEWQQAYLQHLEPHPEATCYVSFFVNGRAIAIFPLRRIRRSVGHIHHWLWELPTHPHLILGDPLISPEWASPDLIQRLLNTLEAKSKLPWDALHLPNLLEDSVTIRLFKTHALSRTHLEKTGQSMFFQCTDMNHALANCSTPFKRNIRRQGKKLAEQGAISLDLAQEGAALDAAFENFLRLEASGWKGRDGKASAIRLHQNLLDFYRELKNRFGQLGECMIPLLKLNDVAIAAQFCLRVDDTVYIQKIAYDEAWHAEAPGNQLLYRLIEYCCADPTIRQLSLVTAPAWAVGRWNPECQNVWEAYVFKASPRGFGGLAMRRFKTRLGAPAQALWKLACSGLRHRLHPGIKA